MVRWIVIAICSIMITAQCWETSYYKRNAYEAIDLVIEYQELVRNQWEVMEEYKRLIEDIRYK